MKGIIDNCVLTSCVLVCKATGCSIWFPHSRSPLGCMFRRLHPHVLSNHPLRFSQQSHRCTTGELMRWYHRKDECVLSIFAEEAKEEWQNVALCPGVPQMEPRSLKQHGACQASCGIGKIGKFDSHIKEQYLYDMRRLKRCFEVLNVK